MNSFVPALVPNPRIDQAMSAKCPLSTQGHAVPAGGVDCRGRHVWLQGRAWAGYIA